MVYSTVKTHQSVVQVPSEPSLGARFQLSFPAVDPVSLPIEASVAADYGAGQPLQIMLVDDDELIRESLGAVLETLGHEVTLACQGGRKAWRF